MKNFTSRQNSLHFSKFRGWQLGVFVVVFGVLGCIVLIVSRAAPKQTNDIHMQGTQLAGDTVLIKLNPSASNTVKGKGHSPNPQDTGLDKLNKLNRQHGVAKMEQVALNEKDANASEPLFQWYKLSLDNSLKKKINPKQDQKDYLQFERILNQYRADAAVTSAEPDFFAQTSAVPNDPYYSSSGSWGQSYADQWDMQKINLAAAWNQTTGSKSVVVADIDTGIDYNHPDLQGNLWTATDGSHGWNFVNNTNNPLDDHGHGTHTAGTIGAVGNNGVGITGVNWSVNIMALKFMDSTGAGPLTSGVNALQWAADHGARVSNNSWGCDCISSMTDDAVKYEHDKGMTVVVAAGNNSEDALSFSPADSDYAVTVSSTDHNDVRSDFSNFGERIDAAAPGGDNRDSTYGTTYTYANILSLRAANTDLYCASSQVCNTMAVGNQYYRARGTSMAAPHVAGLAALLLAKNPNLTNEQIRQIIREGADDLGQAGKDADTGFGRINAGNSMNFVNSQPLTPVISSPNSRATISGLSVTVTGSVGGTNFASWKLEAGKGRSPTAWSTLATSTAQPITDGTLATFDSTKLNDGPIILRLTATNSAGKTFQYEVYDLSVANFAANLYSPINRVSLGLNQVYGYANVKNGLNFTGYKLEWGAGSAPTSWSTAGISLANNGSQAIPEICEDGGTCRGEYGAYGGTLGTWSTSVLTDGQQYTIRLTIMTAQGSTAQYSQTVTVDKTITAGWPKNLCALNCFTYRPTPVMADLTGSGKKELIIPSVPNILYVFNQDGTPFPGFPVTVDSGNYTDDTSVNVADLRGDGQKEIILTASNSTGSGSEIYLFNSNGTRVPGWPITANICQGFYDDGTVSAADLNGTGQNEVIFIDRAASGCFQASGDTQSRINAYLPSGTQLTGFPKLFSHPQPPFYDYGGGTIGESAHLGPPTIADVNNDGKPEIFWSYGDRAYLFDNHGNLMPGWPFIAPTNPSSGTVPMLGSLGGVANYYGDKNLELFVYGHDLNSNGNQLVYGLNNNGTLISGWPQKAGLDINWSWVQPGTVASGDVYHVGRDQVDVPFGPNMLRDYKVANNWIESNSAPYLDDNAEAPIIINGDGSNSLEVLADDAVCGAPTGFIKIDGTVTPPVSTGTNYYVQTTLAPNDCINNPSYVADLSGNGSLSWLTAIEDNLNPNTMNFYLWPLPNNGGKATYDWPMEGHDPAHTSRLANASSGSTDTTPPSVSITSPPSGSIVSGTVTFSANASDNVGVSRVDFSVDGSVVNSDTASPYGYVGGSTTVSNGSHALTATAYDAAGNKASSSISVTVNNGDTTPPSTPTGLTATAPAYNQVNLSWTASTDNVGVVGYYIVRNGTTIAQTSGTGTTYTNSSVNASTTYSYQVMAYDAKGNTSGLSNTASVTTPSVADTTPPTAPSNLTATAVRPTQINLTWHASTDNIGVTSYIIYRNSTKVTSVAGSITSYGDTGLSVSSTYTYYVIALDAAGNRSAQSNTATTTTLATLPNTGYITGKVTDSSTGVGIAGALVSLTLSGQTGVKTVSTASLGGYNMINLAPGTYTAKYSAYGYTTKQYRLNIIVGQNVKSVSLVKQK